MTCSVSAAKAWPTTYSSRSAAVSITSTPARVRCVRQRGAEPSAMDCVNDGTETLRLTMASVARSSNAPVSEYSMRTSCGVSTVKRALPETTTANE